jgi:Cu(I)/Ag(I) efflux system membrane protein CusA/SilA
MVGGMVTSTVLTLIVIPVIYYLWRCRHTEMAAATNNASELR